MHGLPALPDSLGLYLHLPWCLKKCPYCDFNSHTAGSEPPLARYVDALLLDLEREAHRAAGRTVSSVFLGGGTPSLFPPQQVDRLLQAAHDLLDIVPDAEITMEANPGTVDCGAPAGYRAAGVNRLSIGAQSFDDASLQRRGRIHTSEDIRRTVADAVDAGFDNFNLDLMHGLPGQTVDEACADVVAALELGPTHISWYLLTLEPNTAFYARPPEDLPDDDTLYAIQDAGAALLTGGGFEQYEVSAWARDGHRCMHNMNYWLFGDYLAVGAGAHGKMSDPQRVVRYRKAANPLQYMHEMEAGEVGDDPIAVAPTDLPLEFMINALRIKEGVSESGFVERTGLSRDDLATLMQGPLDRGLIERVGQGTWRPTRLGWRFLNDLQAEFLRNF
jgi:oxygen-independent coproporphyrinogen-3 oxidase